MRWRAFSLDRRSALGLVRAVFPALAGGALIASAGCVTARGDLVVPSTSGGADRGVVHLHIEAPTLRVGLAGAASCASPCDRPIDGRGPARFLFRGPDMPDSERFGLSHHSGPVTARVRPGTPGLAPLGYALLGLGLYGVTRAIEGAIVGAILSNIPASRADADTWYLGAGIAAGAGVALSGLGTWLVSRGRTTFELVPVPPPSR